MSLSSVNWSSLLALTSMPRTNLPGTDSATSRPVEPLSGKAKASFFFAGKGLRIISPVAWAVTSDFFSSSANRPAAQASRHRVESQRFMGSTSRDREAGVRSFRQFRVCTRFFGKERPRIFRAAEKPARSVSAGVDSSLALRAGGVCPQPGLHFPALAVLGLDECVGLGRGSSPSCSGRPIPASALAAADGDVAEQDRLGQHGGVVEVRQRRLRLALGWPRPTPPSCRCRPCRCAAATRAPSWPRPEVLGVLAQEAGSGAVVVGRVEDALVADQQRAAVGQLLAVEQLRLGQVLPTVAVVALVPGELDRRPWPRGRGTGRRSRPRSDRSRG